ncbi:MAG TPA: putative zinc-binding peptidase [Rhizomicrobium sp.]|jgi:hypothetical protein|nr:putative zinc-binding peptidase [Rhizomicrobium sp.]
MKVFSCQACGQLVYFENIRCERCGHVLGYLPDRETVSALEPMDGDAWKALAARGRRYRFCRNQADGVCNWLVPASSKEEFCAACRHNRTIPDLTVPENLSLWQRLEWAKHRLFYSLVRLRLPLANRVDDPAHGLTFDFLAEPPQSHGQQVMIGHDSGLITLAVREADDAERERVRSAMGEPYRTLLGHFRHEVGHYFWDVLVRDHNRVDSFRAVFGDESQDYGAALQNHYTNGSPPDWQNNFVSTYASAHPWEDFAETWAHYLHIVDTLETAGAFGVRVNTKRGFRTEFAAKIDFDPYAARSIEQLTNAWLPLAFAVNSLNRSMGQPDLYPFILSPVAIQKLGYIHDLVHRPA